MNYTNGNQTTFSNEIFSLEIIPYLILNSISVLIGFFGKIYYIAKN